MSLDFFCPSEDAILSTSRGDTILLSPGDTSCPMSIANCTFGRQKVAAGGNKKASLRDVLKIVSFVGQNQCHGIFRACI